MKVVERDDSTFSSFRGEDGERLREQTHWIVPEDKDKFRLRFVGNPWSFHAARKGWDDPLSVIPVHDSLYEVIYPNPDSDPGHSYARFNSPELENVNIDHMLAMRVINMQEIIHYQNTPVHTLRIFVSTAESIKPVGLWSRMTGRDPGVKNAPCFCLEYARGYSAWKTTITPDSSDFPLEGEQKAYLHDLLVNQQSYNLEEMFEPLPPCEVEPLLLALKAQPKVCPDCKGTKIYRGFTRVEACSKCKGKGFV
jgi:hypothetical protein